MAVPSPAGSKRMSSTARDAGAGADEDDPRRRLEVGDPVLHRGDAAAEPNAEPEARPEADGPVVDPFGGRDARDPTPGSWRSRRRMSKASSIGRVVSIRSCMRGHVDLRSWWVGPGRGRVGAPAEGDDGVPEAPPIGRARAAWHGTRSNGRGRRSRYRRPFAAVARGDGGQPDERVDALVGRPEQRTHQRRGRPAGPPRVRACRPSRDASMRSGRPDLREPPRPLADEGDLGALRRGVRARAVVRAAGELQVVEVEPLGVHARPRSPR